MSGIDYAIVAGFLLFMALAGLLISRLIRTSDDIFVAGRELTPFILCATITATNLSMFHFIGMGGTAYQSGASISWQVWTGCIALVISGLFVVPVMRRLKVRSVPEFLEIRYSRGLRTLIGAFWGVRLCVYLAILLYIASTAAIIITGVQDTNANYVKWLIAFSFVSIIYSTVGGAWAVAIMDSVQFCVMLAGGLIVVAIATHAAGGMPAILKHFDSIPGDIHTHLVPAKGAFNWLFIFAILMLSLKWSMVDQAILQRAFGARTPRMAAKGMILSAIITSPFVFLWVFPGLAAAKLHPGFSNPDEAVPWLLSHTIPQVGRGILGVVLCGLIAAQVSAITADVNSVATLFTNDVYRNIRLWRDARRRRRNSREPAAVAYAASTVAVGTLDYAAPREYAPAEPADAGPSQRELLLVVRISSVLCGALMLAVAMYLRRYGAGAVKLNLAVVGILDMPLLVVTVVYGMFWRRANWQGATAGFLLGGTTGIFVNWWMKNHGYNADFVRNLTPFIGTAAALIITPVVTLLTGRANHDAGQVWRAFATKDPGTEHDTFHLIPVSGRGRLGLGLVVLGVLSFLIGIFSGHWAVPTATPMAVGGMLTVFVGGALRAWSE